MLLVDAPANFREERRYVAEVVLGDFLGISFDMQFTDRRDTLLSSEGRELRVADGLFSTIETDWLEPFSLPEHPLAVCDVSGAPFPLRSRDPLPLLFQEPVDRILVLDSTSRARLGLDIFGTVFFFLTRYEEAALQGRLGGEAGRFPASASTAVRGGFVDRPIVNEYVDVLSGALSRLWPGLEQRKRQFRTILTHDVDAPFEYAFASAARVVRSAARALRDHGIRAALERFPLWYRVRNGDPAADPYATFDWIMDTSEHHGLRSAFYFITEQGPMDADYTLDHPWISGMIRSMAERGHEVGLHGSFDSYDDGARLAREFGKLNAVCERHGVRQDAWGGRQHFLRCRVPGTLQNWCDAGLAYDSTLAFAEVAGFRCGTCWEFTPFNLRTRKPIGIRERPLVVMECSVTDAAYMGLGLGAEAFAAIAKIKDACRKYDGDFTLLWHNSRLADPASREFYREVIAH